MAYDTKALLASISQNVAKSKTVKEAYWSVMQAANVEGMHLPTYEEVISEIEALRQETEV